MTSLTMTDLFCGMGGSSTGAIEHPGVTVRMAANHWKMAIDTHQLNHPDADHSNADLSQVRPQYFPKTDLLWASPECTNHSVAQGRKRVTAQRSLFDTDSPEPEDADAAERSRATMWDVPRFAEVHKYKAIIVENVVDAARWVMFDAWLSAMTALGYEHHIVYLNSMHAQHGGLPAPQARDRMYVCFWRKGTRRPDFDRFFRPKAYCTGCDAVVDAMQVFKKAERWGRYRAQYVYRCPNVKCRNQIVEPGWLPAIYAIDWSIRGQRIGDREKPLAPKTMARIQAGLDKLGGQRMHLDAAGNTYDSATPERGGAYYRIWPETDPLRTLHTTLSKGMVVPAGGTWNDEARPLSEPLRALTTRDANALVMAPFLSLLRSGRARNIPVSDVLATLTTEGAGHLLVQPFLTNHVSGADASRSENVSGPMKTIVSSGSHLSLLVPVEGRDGKEAAAVHEAMRTQTTRNETALVMSYYGKGGVHSVADPIGTISTRDRHAMITTMRGANAPKGVDAPLDTFAASGTHHGLSEWSVPRIEDCEFRMLEPHEIKAGMAFQPEYKVLGSKREQVKMAGNAVTPPAARDLVACMADALGVPA